MMAGIKGKDTQPELLIRRALHKQGLRFRLHAINVPGKPDLVLPRFRVAIFVNGCFWHHHNCHLFKMPKTRSAFWAQKMERNVERDAYVRGQLSKEGWRFLVVWECALRGRTRRVLDDVIVLIVQWLYSSESTLEIGGVE
jgi:DNA mismatch endonuclease (patch repair protein)